MDETLFYISEGNTDSKDSQGSFAHAVSIHGPQLYASFREADCFRNGAALTGAGTGERLFLANKHKALLSVYLWGKEGVEQRMPIPEALCCIALCKHPRRTSIDSSNSTNIPSFRLPYILAGGTSSGRLYLWELSSGNLMTVRDIHYQAITVLKFSACGTFLISGSKDTRCIVWRTADLLPTFVSGELPSKTVKPFAVFTDHTLPITDLYVSQMGLVNDLRIYSCSRDGTLRVYDLLTKQLLTTFVLPYPIECITVDPAGRACYAALANGSIRSIPMYSVNKKNATIESIGGIGKTITMDSDPDLLHSFIMHRTENATSMKNGNKNTHSVLPVVSCLELSMDGSILFSADTLGRVIASDVASKQIIKSFPATKSAIAYIEVRKLSLPRGMDMVGTNKHSRNSNLVPPLKRTLISEDQLDHHVYIEIASDAKNEQNLNSWLDEIAREEMAFKNFSNIDSSVKIAKSDESQDSESESLKIKLRKVSEAYENMRKVHEKLVEDHKNLLRGSK